MRINKLKGKVCSDLIHPYEAFSDLGGRKVIDLEFDKRLALMGFEGPERYPLT